MILRQSGYVSGLREITLRSSLDISIQDNKFLTFVLAVLVKVPAVSPRLGIVFATKNTYNNLQK
jgi:hypothetical protein